MSLVDTLMAMMLVAMALMGASAVSVRAHQGYHDYRHQSAIWNLATSVLVSTEDHLKSEQFDVWGAPTQRDPAFALEVTRRDEGWQRVYECRILDIEQGVERCRLQRRFAVSP
ncbi:MAG: hypothetical protein KDC35_18135 [Acidobacteria bacterium]|nr:hypothetical protein [Acidobacteriota bacterium]